jgi:hypothetical protein
VPKPRPNADLPTVKVENITLAGPAGDQLAEAIRDIGAGHVSVEEAIPRLTRGEDGMLTLQVTNDTIDLVAGRAEVQRPGKQRRP